MSEEPPSSIGASDIDRSLPSLVSKAVARAVVFCDGRAEVSFRDGTGLILHPRLSVSYFHADGSKQLFFSPDAVVTSVRAKVKAATDLLSLFLPWPRVHKKVALWFSGEEKAEHYSSDASIISARYTKLLTDGEEQKSTVQLRSARILSLDGDCSVTVTVLAGSSTTAGAADNKEATVRGNSNYIYNSNIYSVEVSFPCLIPDHRGIRTTQKADKTSCIGIVYEHVHTQQLFLPHTLPPCWRFPAHCCLRALVADVEETTFCENDAPAGDAQLPRRRLTAISPDPDLGEHSCVIYDDREARNWGEDEHATSVRRRIVREVVTPLPASFCADNRRKEARDHQHHGGGVVTSDDSWYAEDSFSPTEKLLVGNPQRGVLVVVQHDYAFFAQQQKMWALPVVGGRRDGRSSLALPTFTSRSYGEYWLNLQSGEHLLGAAADTLKDALAFFGGREGKTDAPAEQHANASKAAFPALLKLVKELSVPHLGRFSCYSCSATVPLDPTTGSMIPSKPRSAVPHSPQPQFFIRAQFLDGVRVEYYRGHGNFTIFTSADAQRAVRTFAVPCGAEEYLRACRVFEHEVDVDAGAGWSDDVGKHTIEGKLAGGREAQDSATTRDEQGPGRPDALAVCVAERQLVRCRAKLMEAAGGSGARASLAEPPAKTSAAMSCTDIGFFTKRNQEMLASLQTLLK
eukprot:g17467.t1